MSSHLYVRGDVAPFLISVHNMSCYQTAIVLLFGPFPLYHGSTALFSFFADDDCSPLTAEAESVWILCSFKQYTCHNVIECALLSSHLVSIKMSRLICSDDHVR